MFAPVSAPASGAPAPLAGHVVAFTGKLWSLSHKDAQALVVRLGGVTSDDLTARTTMLVVGEAPVRPGDDAPGEEGTQKLRRARTVNDQEPGRIRILAEDEFCSLAGLPSPAALRAQYYPLRDVLAMYPQLREDHARYLEKWGLVRPVARTHAGPFFSFADLCLLRQINGEMGRSVPFRAIVRALIAQRSGQMALDFRSDAEPARIVALPRRIAGQVTLETEIDTELVIDRAEAEKLFAEASALDNGEPATREEAAQGYRRALEADPYLIPALINLGNLHYARDELVEAQALYERVLLLAPEVYEAHFNLGNVHHDLGRFEIARGCYQEAVRLNPDYADAHFYLAVTLEKMGRSSEAKPHWRAYQQLAPNGEWIDLAREFSE